MPLVPAGIRRPRAILQLTIALVAGGLTGCDYPTQVAAQGPDFIAIRYNDSLIGPKPVEDMARGYCAERGLDSRMAGRANTGLLAFPRDRFDCVRPPPPPA